jgi:hypothetical protein
LVGGLLMKYSVQHGRSGHHDDDIYIKSLTAHNFPTEILPTEKKCKPTRCCVVYSKHNKWKETVYYFHITIALCIDECFEAYHTRKNYGGNVNCIYIIYSILENTIQVSCTCRVRQKYQTILQHSCEWNRWRKPFNLEHSSSDTQSISFVIERWSVEYQVFAVETIV